MQPRTGAGAARGHKESKKRLVKICTEAATPVFQAEDSGGAGPSELRGKALEGSVRDRGEELFYAVAPAKPCSLGLRQLGVNI